MEQIKRVTVSQIADRLGLTPHAVRKAILKYEVQIFKVGHRWRISESDAKRLIERLEKEGQI